jgi:hypothetical protein
LTRKSNSRWSCQGGRPRQHSGDECSLLRELLAKSEVAPIFIYPVPAKLEGASYNSAEECKHQPLAPQPSVLAKRAVYKQN